MNAANVEYGTLAESTVSSGSASVQSISRMVLPHFEKTQVSPTQTVYARVEGRVHAAPHQILAFLRDYLAASVDDQPKGYFKDIEVEEGGVGGGTVYHATIALHGIILNRLVAVSEPERNVLVETDIYTGMRTTFSVRAGIGCSWLRISTELPDEPVNAPLPSPALVRSINVAELMMAQRHFA